MSPRSLRLGTRSSLHDALRVLALMAPLILSGFMTAHAGVQDDAVFPDTVAANRVKGWFEFFNGDDVEAFLAFETQNKTESSLSQKTLDQRRGSIQQLRQMMGEVKIDSIVDESKTSMTVLGFAKNNSRWFEFKFIFEKAPSAMLDAILIMPGSEPKLSRLEWTDWSNLEDLLTQVVADTKLPAIAAAIIVDGRVLDQAAVGVRILGTDERVAPNDKFHWGSVAKSATATMIGKLVEEGVIRWDSTIGEILPDIPMRDEYRDITLELLLQHRAGVPMYGHVGEAVARHDRRGTTNPDHRASFVTEALSQPPTSSPDTKMEYSNAGYVVAGHMAERAAGRSWEELIREHIFEANGMTTGGYKFPRTEADPRQPGGHIGDGPKLRHYSGSKLPMPAAMAPAGHIHSSIGDFAQYALAHLNGLQGKDGYLKSETIKRLHTTSSRDSGPMQYASGWFIFDVGDEIIHRHDGTPGNFYAEVQLFPESNFGIVIMMNAVSDSGLVVRKITNTVRRHFRDHHADG